MNKYKAKVTDIFDANKIIVDVDLGFRTTIKSQSIRLYGINAREREEKPNIAKDWLVMRLLDKEIELETFKGKKGRDGEWLGIIHLDGVDINNELFKQGFAEINFYKE